MAATAIINKDGTVLMPTFNIKKVRRLLRTGRAEIYSYHPFAVKLTYQAAGYTQRVDFDMDSGFRHAGVSVKSEKHEYLHQQVDMLPDEKQRHDDCRKNRRNRRNRLRYRKPRFQNRKKEKGWLAPSIRHRMECQVQFFEKCLSLYPMENVHLEVASFDTMVLEAIEKGEKIPEGTDYQHGSRYQSDTLRAAVFFRDNYTCQCCGKSLEKNPGLILVTHHAYYWRDDHTDRMGGLMTLCTGCHTSANHEKGGKLWGLELESSNKSGAAFMNTVRWKMLDKFKESGIPVHATYGTLTKRERRSRNLEKTHANDAYCIGELHPKHRSHETLMMKKRRNDRILEKFHDTAYIDSRTGEEASGKALSCGRTKRCEPRHGQKDLRPFRKEKIRRGYRQIRERRYDIRPGEMVLYNGKIYKVNGTQNKGKSISLYTVKEVLLDQLAPKTDKDGVELPVLEGQKLALKGKKTKHRVLSIHGDTATMEWFFAVKPEKLTRMEFNYGGWGYPKTSS